MQPAILFVGERFDSDPDFKLAKSMLLDMFRGQQVRPRYQPDMQLHRPLHACQLNILPTGADYGGAAMSKQCVLICVPGPTVQGSTAHPAAACSWCSFREQPRDRVLRTCKLT